MLLSYLSDFARGEVPDLDEAVHRAGDQVLTIRGESGTLHMRLLSELIREEMRSCQKKHENSAATVRTGGRRVP